MRSLIDILELSTQELDDLIATAMDIIAHPERYREACRYKKLATLFFEPSTRTRLSFEAAMYELGGHVIGFSDAKNSSVSKGESVSDTLRVVSSEDLYAENPAYMPRTGYEKDEVFHYNDTLKKTLAELWIKVKAN